MILKTRRNSVQICNDAVSTNNQEKKSRHTKRARSKTRASHTANASPLKKEYSTIDKKENALKQQLKSKNKEIESLKDQLKSQVEKANNEKIIYESKLAAKELKYREQLEAELIEQKIQLRVGYLKKIDRLKQKFQALNDIESRCIKQINRLELTDKEDPQCKTTSHDVLTTKHWKYNFGF